MNDIDTAKLKVLIKRILLEKKPKQLTCNMLANIINEDYYGFKSNVSSKKVGWLLSRNVGSRQKNIFSNIGSVKKGKSTYYYVI